MKSIWCNTQQPRQRPTDARSRVGVTSRRYIHLLILISKLERCFLNTRRGLVKFPVANYVTCKWKSVVVRLSAFEGHSLIIKSLDFTTYPCRRLFATSPVKESISFWWMLSGRSWQHLKVRTGVFFIRRMCENIFGALEIVGAQLKEKRKKERLEKSSVKAKMT